MSNIVTSIEMWSMASVNLLASKVMYLYIKFEGPSFILEYGGKSLLGTPLLYVVPGVAKGQNFSWPRELKIQMSVFNF